MDGYTTEPRAKNPRESANIFQKFLFLFTIPTFRKGLQKGLDENDIYEIIPEYKADSLGLSAEKIWNEERRKENPKLLKCFWKLFTFEFVALGLFNVVFKTFLMIIQPILIGKLVSYFNQIGMSQKDAWLYTLAFVVSNLGNTWTTHIYMFGIEQLSLKTQVACCNLIFKKCLTLSSVSSTEVAAGQAVTLVTKDIGSFYFSIHFAQQLVVGGIQTVLMTYIIYREIGEAAFAGVILLILFIPIQVFVGKFTSKYRLQTAAKTDERIKVTQEILTAMRIVKMYTWEIFFSKKINNLRKSEIENLRILFYIKAFVVSIGHLTARFGFYVCVLVYIVLGNHITAEKAFVTLACFGALRSILTTFIPLGIAQIANLKASLQRIQKFLLLEETQKQNKSMCNDENFGYICIANVTVKTSNNSTVLDNVSFDGKKGLTAITGPTGAGKSTLLKLLLGDVPNESGTVAICGKLSYASQEPWLFPATVRQNIIFGEHFDEDRYKRVIEICALHADISTFHRGDGTLVTDRGLNLSRGQKARINLARAVYREADIYLLDDCFSSVDNRVGNYIFYKCVKDFLKNSTCILVTNNRNHLIEADHIVFLNNGALSFSGSYGNLKDCNDDAIQSWMNAYVESPDAKVVFDEPAEDGISESSALLPQTVENTPKPYKENIKHGSVGKKVYGTYLTSGGGVPMLLLLSIIFLVTQGAASWSDYFVSFWVNLELQLGDLQKNNSNNTVAYTELEKERQTLMTSYSLAIAITILFTLIRSFVYYVWSTKASINLHNLIMDKILNNTMTFFDNNLSGNIINRFSRDLEIVDEHLPNVLFEFLRVILFVLGILVVISTVNLYLIIPSVVFIVTLNYIRNLYMQTARNLKRLEGSTRSPVIGHLTATLEGLTTIRSNYSQNVVTRQFESHQDLYNSTVYMNLSTSRAFGFLLDLLAGLYMYILIIFFLSYKSDTIVGNIGLAITQAYTLVGLLQWGIRELAEMQNQMISMERFLEYQCIHSENKSGRVFTTWPYKGCIVFKNINLSYNENVKTLNNISFEIGPKQKIGIVGRTGAGKTSLISALFRLYYYEGVILIDGVDIKTLSISYLRSKISIIPQDPVLFSGSLRSNLDPYSRYPDKVLWDALESVEMKKSIKSLDDDVNDGDSQFSTGEKQLLCLARAIIQQNNILVLDEATANIDSQTDSIIQNIIRKNFSDCTVITIAHKLQNILDNDKVLVIDSGSIVEFHHPKVLLKNKTGVFYTMVKEAGLL